MQLHDWTKNNGAKFRTSRELKKMNTKVIRMIAEEELADEAFRAEVEKEKQRLRAYRPWWHKLFPYKIVFVRRT